MPLVVTKKVRLEGGVCEGKLGECFSWGLKTGAVDVLGFPLVTLFLPLVPMEWRLVCAKKYSSNA